jgi:penicillin-binding protein 2
MTAEQTIFCPGHFNLPGSAHQFRDWKPKGHGVVAMRHAIMQSCDVYFYTVANRLGIDRMHDFMSTFGFGDITGIDIPGEKPGLMPSTEWKRHAYRRAAEQVWYPGETISVGIGQGYMTATPMQLAHAVSGIASRGQIFKPRLVTAVRASGSSTASQRPVQREPSMTAVSPEQWGVIVDGMELATGPGGTAAAATAGTPYKIAGKTGSAQVFTIGQNEKYNEKQVSERNLDHALFISFAPADNPKLAVAVFVENGKHGGSTAAPIARKMFDAYLLPDKAPAVELPVVGKAL